MSVFVAVGVISVLMLVYMIAVLGALPWFIYIPFVLLFALVFFWDRIRLRVPGLNKAVNRTGRRRFNNLKGALPANGGGGNSKTKHGGKRI